MTRCIDKKNFLQHSGTNQLDRELKQLLPDYIKVNEKSLEQWTTFTSSLVEKLKFYDLNNVEAGNWGDLFNAHPIVTYARISTQDIESIRVFIKDRFDILREKYKYPLNVPSTQAAQDAQIAEMRLAYSEIFSAIFTICLFIDQQLAVEKSAIFKARLLELVSSKLKPALRKILGYFKGAGIQLIVPVNDSTKVIWGTGLISHIELLNQLQSPEWFDFILPTTNALDYYNNDLAPDISIYTPESTIPLSDNREIYEALNRAARHNLFTMAVDAFTHASSFLQAQAKKAFEESLLAPELTPHIALYFSFLHILKEAQSNLNQFTDRHLDFFYRQVLRLKPSSAKPNYGHICAQIGKQVPSYLLPRNTKFKAGKDADGKEIYYALTEDTLFNHAEVSEIKSFYVADVSDNTTQIYNQGKAFASFVANSADGIGKEIADEPAAWHPFGNKKGRAGASITMLMPSAKLGFAIASPYLLLREGDRTINVTFTTAQAQDLKYIPFKCEYTSAKGWVSDVKVNVQVLNSNTIAYKIVLDSNYSSFEGYNEEIHKESIETVFPVLKFVLDDNNFSAVGKFEKIKYAQFAKCKIDVAVGAWVDNESQIGPQSFTGLKSLYLSNDLGSIDGRKPFNPFGKPAKANTYLSVGNQELFVKPDINYQVIIEQTDLPPSTDVVYGELPDPILKIEHLQNGTWKERTSLNIKYPTKAFGMLIPDDKIDKAASVSFLKQYQQFDSSSSNGFLKINLKEDFGDDEYQNFLIQYRILQSRGWGIDYNKDGDFNGSDEHELPRLPAQPYAPRIKRITVNYKAKIELDFSITSTVAENFSYHYLYPFGTKKLTNTIVPRQALLHGTIFQLSNISVYQSLILQKNRLVRVPIGVGQIFGTQKPMLPQFEGPRTQNSNARFISELYIGLKNTQPLQRVNILFQVLDGSTNPLVEKPLEHLHWYYLSDNEWKQFANNKIKDYTDQLLRSGIINFEIPDDANDDNTMLPKGAIWIKAGIVEKPDAVSRLIDIKAQAALVELVENGNSPTLLNNQLPAGSISKLLEPSAYIKSVKQLYPTFGGRTYENHDKFRVRVSERLRHKDRGIQIFDYERLVLQQFTSIQKVKCLNHTRYEPGLVYNEQCPGHVTLVTIPYVNGNSTSDPLKPYTSTRELSEIKKFISTKISPHIKVHVQNPVFEEVKLQFKVRFIEGIDEKFYMEQLRNELTQFLTPWAYNDFVEISFGGKIHKSAIVDFIEERSYVDFISDVKMYKKKDDGISFSADVDTVAGATGRSILVSASPELHLIERM